MAKLKKREPRQATGIEKVSKKDLEVKAKTETTRKHLENLPVTAKFESDFLKSFSGTDKEALAVDIIFRATLATPEVTPGTNATELILSSIQDLKPQNVLEGMLCSQLISLHYLGMNYLKKVVNTDMPHQQDPSLNNAIKLLRLQHETIETLARLRRNGEQKVIVQHIHVNDGGKAIVGSVLNGGGGQQQKICEVPHGHDTDL